MRIPIGLLDLNVLVGVAEVTFVATSLAKVAVVVAILQSCLAQTRRDCPHNQEDLSNEELVVSNLWIRTHSPRTEMARN